MNNEVPLVEVIELTGDSSNRGRLLGENSPEMVREVLKKYWKTNDSFESPYFRKNFVFMKREFPELIEEVEAFGAAAGLSPEEAYFTQIYSTGNTGCSALAIQTRNDGPIMLRTIDPFSLEEVTSWYQRGDRAVIHRGLKPHAYAAIQSCITLSPATAVNDAGLMVGGASGHPKFNFQDNPETINLYWWTRIFAQYCSDCKDARYYANRYKCSGVKGINIVVADSKGDALGIEFESENIAFREPEDGIILEVNHFQHPDLVKPSLNIRSDFWGSSYHLNSMNRVMYVNYNRERFKAMETMDEMIDFSYEKGWPGRILQIQGLNIGDWLTYSASFVKSRDKSIRYHNYPLDKDRYQLIRL
ncbi:MAG: hypothetical protein HPY74_00180 [Firmicutes bacterium]|nr:hypothetical protein [Bacillota bacterium]